MEGIYDNLQRLPPGWQRVKIGDEIEVIRGASPRPKGDPRYFGGSIPWIMISDVTKENGKFISKTRDHVTEEGAGKSRYLKAGTLILSNSATVCVPKILGVDGCIHDGFVAFPNLPKRFDILYLYYFFEFIRSRVIDAHRQGITQVNLNTTIVKNIQVPIAPPNEQKRIVAEIEKQFSRLDEAIGNLKRVKANLKRYKAAVLKAAVEGKLTEDWRKAHPDVEPASELLKRILAERRAKWNGKGKYKESAVVDATSLPSLPKRWTWALVDQLSIVVRGASPRPAGHPKYFGGNIPWITVGPLTADDQPYLRSVPETVTAAGRKARRYIERETLLLTNSGATLGIPKITLIGGCINDGVAALLNVDYPLKLYLYYFLRSQTERLRAINQGATQPNLNTTIIKAIPVPLPPYPSNTRL